jgi:hypothetical protein
MATPVRPGSSINNIRFLRRPPEPLQEHQRIGPSPTSTELSHVPHTAKTTQARLLAFLLIAPLFSACSYTMNQNPLMEGVVRSASLGDGKTLAVGYKLPEAAAECQLINETSRNWAMAGVAGQLKMGGGREVLQDEAVESVKQRPQDGVNYVVLTIPNEAGLGIVNVTAMRDAKTSYFRCASPPQPR